MTAAAVRLFLPAMLTAALAGALADSALAAPSADLYEHYFPAADRLAKCQDLTSDEQVAVEVRDPNAANPAADAAFICHTKVAGQGDYCYLRKDGQTGIAGFQTANGLHTFAAGYNKPKCTDRAPPCLDSSGAPDNSKNPFTENCTGGTPLAAALYEHYFPAADRASQCDGYSVETQTIPLYNGTDPNTRRQVAHACFVPSRGSDVCFQAVDNNTPNASLHTAINNPATNQPYPLAPRSPKCSDERPPCLDSSGAPDNSKNPFAENCDGMPAPPSCPDGKVRDSGGDCVDPCPDGNAPGPYGDCHTPRRTNQTACETEDPLLNPIGGTWEFGTCVYPDELFQGGAAACFVNLSYSCVDDFAAVREQSCHTRGLLYKSLSNNVGVESFCICPTTGERSTDSCPDLPAAPLPAMVMIAILDSPNGTVFAASAADPEILSGEVVAASAVVTFTAAPAGGYELARWTGDCAGDSDGDLQCAIAPTLNATVGADFGFIPAHGTPNPDFPDPESPEAAGLRDLCDPPSAGVGYAFVEVNGGMNFGNGIRPSGKSGTVCNLPQPIVHPVTGAMHESCFFQHDSGFDRDILLVVPHRKHQGAPDCGDLISHCADWRKTVPGNPFSACRGCESENRWDDFPECGPCLPGATCVAPEDACPDRGAKGKYGDCNTPRLTDRMACETADPAVNPLGGSWRTVSSECLLPDAPFSGSLVLCGGPACPLLYESLRELPCIAQGLRFQRDSLNAARVENYCICPSTGARATDSCPDIALVEIFISPSPGGTVSVSWSRDSDVQSGEAVWGGARVTFTARPDDARALTLWTGACAGDSAGDSQCVLDGVTTATTVGAEFGCADDLHAAARDGSLAGTECNLNAGADVNARDAAEATPLHLAVQNSRLAVMTLLLSARASLNAQNLIGLAPLHLAAAGSGLAAARALLEAGADPNLAGGVGNTPLFSAIEARGAEMMALLLDHGADLNHASGAFGTPLAYAVVDQDSPEEIVSFLIENGAHYGAPCDPPDRVNPESASPPCVNYILVSLSPLSGGTVSVSWSEDSDVQFGDGILGGSAVTFTALPEAGRKLSLWTGACAGDSAGDSQCVLNAAADVTVGAEFGCTDDFHGASQNFASVKCNLDAGRNVDERDNFGGTALHWAAFNGLPAVVSLLLERDANVNLRDNITGATPLHDAAGAGPLEVVLLLLSASPSLNVADSQGRAPLTRAVAGDREEVFRLLAAAGAHHGTDCAALDPPLTVNPRSATPPCLSYVSVSVAASSGGTVSISWSGDADVRGDEGVMNGATVTFAALPDGGYSLSLWGGICEGVASDSECVREVTTDATVSVLFSCTDLHAAAAAGNLAGLNCVLAAGGDVNARDGMDRTPLHWAAGEGRLEAAQRLLTLGAAVNATDADGDTPLTEAAARGHSAVFALLAALGGRHAGSACGASEVPNPSGASPPCVSCGANKVASGGLCECDADFGLISGRCVHRENAPAQNRETCAEIFGGDWVDLSAAHGSGKGVCSGIDINDTFCLAGTGSALPCLGLFGHVRDCNLLGRPALDPWHCGRSCAGGKASGARCLE